LKKDLDLLFFIKAGYLLIIQFFIRTWGSFLLNI